MKLFLIIFGIVIIICAFIPRIKRDVWWVRGFEFPHAQLSFLCVFNFLIYFFYSSGTPYDWLFLLLLGATISYQLIILFPYTRLCKVQVRKSNLSVRNKTISILSANIYMFNKESKLIQDSIEEQNPDIVSLLETNERWRSEMEYLKTEYPYFIETPREDTYGILLYSKLELFDQDIRFLVEEDVPSLHFAVQLNNQKISLHCLHPKPPSPTENKKSTERDAELLIVAKSVRNNEGPVIVFGDLNDVAWSRTTRLFQKISGLLDPRIGRGFFNTFHVKYPFLRWPLDHFFHSHHFSLITIKKLSNVGSDHFPIFIRLLLDYEMNESDIPYPSINKGIIERANTKINKVVDGKHPRV